MGCCDDDRNQTTGGSITNNSSDNDDDTQNQEQVTFPEDVVFNPEEAQRDVWATAEGYTPLADLNANNPYNTAGSILVSFGGGSVEHEGAFFVNPSAFRSEEEEEEIEEVEEENFNADNEDSVPEFNIVADNALRILEEEYQRTLRGERPARWSEQQQQQQQTSSLIHSTTTTTPESTTRLLSPGCSTETQTETDKSASQIRQKCKDDDDIKVIVEAFDRKKGELDSSKEVVEAATNFDVDWGEVPTTVNPSSTISSKTYGRLSPVDTAAVRKAVTEISSKTDGSFQQKFAVWQERQQKSACHGLIPTAPLRAFQRSTEKAKQASLTLSRSATIAEAIVRLADKGLLETSKQSLSIHIIGVDHVECASTERIQVLFRPLVRWLGTSTRFQYSKLFLRLNGRDLQVDQSTSNPMVDLLTPNTRSRLSTAIATTHTGLYDEWLGNEVKPEKPDLVVAFNAGVWGYDSWTKTFDFLNKEREAVPVIITAYTLEESEEDFEVLLARIAPEKTLWRPANNPFGSKTVRETKSSRNEYRENAAWQAWLLGGT